MQLSVKAMRSRQRPHLLAIGAMVSLFSVACGAGVGGSSSGGSPAGTSEPGQPTAPTPYPPPGEDVMAAGMVPSGQNALGWVLTPSGLRVRASTTSNWLADTPAGVAGSDVLSVDFAASGAGLLVTRGQPGSNRLTVWTTPDEGHSWAHSQTPANDSLTYSGLLYVDVDMYDASNAWMAIVTGSLNLPHTQFLRTTDGGTSFVVLSAPSSGRPHFATATDGWILPDVGSTLSVTHDGGTSWSAVSLRAPQAYASDRAYFGGPQTSTPLSSAVAATFVERTQPYADALVIYFTPDDGRTWGEAAVVANPHPEGGVLLPVSQVDPNSAVVALPADSAGSYVLKVTGDRGRTFSAHQDPNLRDVTAITFASSQVGWAVVQFSGCAQGKSQCTTASRLLETDDGGASWHFAGP